MKKRFSSKLQYVMLSLASAVMVLAMAGPSLAAMDCSSCHGNGNPLGTDMRPVDAPNRDVATGGFQGTHQKHMPSAVAPATLGSACTTCHSPVSGNAHRDGGISVVAGVNYSKGVFFNQTSVPTLGTCSVSCHSAFTDVERTTPVWGGTADCTSCHDATPATGAHSNHLSKTAVVSGCADCHGASFGTRPDHINGTLDVPNLSYQATAKHASTAPYNNTCTTTCHTPYLTAVTTPAWGAQSTCNSCHSQIPPTGAHASHVLAPNVTCGSCHAGASAGVSGGASHYDGNIDVTVTGYAQNIAKKAENTGFGSTCSTNCHSTFTDVANTTPAWNESVTCFSCHDLSPATGSHTQHANQSVACTTCHTSFGASDHFNGTIDVANYPVTPKHAAGAYEGTCSTSCHADAYSAGTVTTPVWGTTGNGCSACHSTPIGANGPATGGHTISGHAAACTNCHSAGTTQTTFGAGHNDGNIDIIAGYPANVTKHAAGTYTGTCSTATCHANVYGAGSVTTPVWGTTGNGCSACHTTSIGANGPATGSHTTVAAHAVACITCHAAGTTSASSPSAGHNDGNIDVANVGYPADKAKGSAAASCSTASCHANVYGSGTITSPVWGSTGNGCSACHTTPIGANGPATGSHTTVAAHAVECITCHAAGTTSTSSPSTGHTDGNIDVANVGYPADKAKGSAAASCSTASCHANVYGSGTITTPVWGSTGNGCSACHTTPIGANGPATGSHTTVTAHAVACITCHAAGTTSTSSPSTGHTDGNIDVANVGYPADKAKGSAAASCSTASCHANVYGTGSVASPVWGTTGNGCSSCHSVAIGANGPATGSHTIAGHAAACTSCHAAGTAQGTAPSTGHNDGNIDIIAGYPADVTKHAAGSYTGTCSTASCHANVYGTGTVITPVWGTTGNGCSACHTTPIGANGPATGSHTIAGHAAACTSCHEAGTAQGTAPSTGHNDGNIDIIAGYPANVTKHAAGSYTGTCSTATCHANVYGSGSVTSPVWGTTGNGCAACHTTNPITADGPATGGHSAHAGAACTSCHAAGTSASTVPSTGHADGDIDVTVGGYPANVAKHTAGSGYSTCSNVSCHSFPTRFTGAPATWGAELNCAGCHSYPPANPSHNGVTSGCNSCHSSVNADGDVNTSTFFDPSKHMNGIIDGGNCNSCHGYPPVQGVITRLPGTIGTQGNYSGALQQNYSGGGGVHAVAGHLLASVKPSDGFGTVGSSTRSCATCHANATHNEGYGSFSTHYVQVTVDPKYKFDKNLPIVYSGVQSGASKSSGTCSNVACHFKASPTWSSEPYTQSH